MPGAGNKRENFENQIKNSYALLIREGKKRNQILVTFTRTGSAIVQIYKKARCEFIKFEGSVMAIRAKTPTGSTSEDDIS
ncbi:hypothetical protein BWQ96_06265 [Gracilariopsis chorda]|uniref:Uncharacterized protein n=1 Tax=Gracilariopsis chorda TaxID=448386 RepID=A0A2V3IPE1_9FLOR|nr:hypothetical protein BWQ96_06265 [Gracilariopsis chorda]|eukprot:PXF43955.1 hypothetical protein BWQ96_06265 [Gracilariopsis chorda]